MSSYKYYEDDDERAIRTGYIPKKSEEGLSTPPNQGSGAKLDAKAQAAQYGCVTAQNLVAANLTISDPDVNIVFAGIDYKYDEGKILEEIRKYINKTYGEHYSQNNYQATEFIIDGGHGTGFTLGNILKYAQRYGHKGNPSDWRKDLMKVIHYAIIALYVHDLNNKG